MLDPESRALLDRLAAEQQRPIVESTPEQARALNARRAERYGPGPAMHAVREETVPGSDGNLRVRVLEPSAAPTAVIVAFHGGGWVLGSIDGHEPIARELAARTGATVILVAYRKAPEAPFPAAVEDAWAALLYAEQLRRRAGDAIPLVVAGDSAGANLAIVAALRARDRGGPAVDAALLVYPVVDTDTDRPSYLDPANQLMLSRASMRWFLDHYAAGAVRDDPEVAPLRRVDWTGFPPTVLLIAEHDPLRDEDEEFAVRLAAAGVRVERLLLAGQMHGFLPMLGVLTASRDAAAAMGDALMTLIRSREETSP